MVENFSLADQVKKTHNVLDLTVLLIYDDVANDFFCLDFRISQMQISGTFLSFSFFFFLFFFTGGLRSAP